MILPIKLSVAGLVFEAGQLAVAYSSAFSTSSIRTFPMRHIRTEVPEFRGTNRIPILQLSCLPAALAPKLGGFDHAGGEREERETAFGRAGG